MKSREPERRVSKRAARLNRGQTMWRERIDDRKRRQVPISQLRCTMKSTRIRTTVCLDDTGVWFRSAHPYRCREEEETDSQHNPKQEFEPPKFHPTQFLKLLGSKRMKGRVSPNERLESKIGDTLRSHRLPSLCDFRDSARDRKSSSKATFDAREDLCEASSNQGVR